MDTNVRLELYKDSSVYVLERAEMITLVIYQ
jgi:hypothetical protein